MNYLDMIRKLLDLLTHSVRMPRYLDVENLLCIPRAEVSRHAIYRSSPA